MSRKTPAEKAAKAWIDFFTAPVRNDLTIYELLVPAFENAIDAYIRDNSNPVIQHGDLILKGSDGWEIMDTNLDLNCVDLWVGANIVLEHFTDLKVEFSIAKKNEEQAILFFSAQSIKEPKNKSISHYILVDTSPRFLPQNVEKSLPDPDSRSINEPCYLMSAKDVRNLFNGRKPERWEFEKLKAMAEGLGWYEVEQYGNQILFRAKLAIRREDV